MKAWASSQTRSCPTLHDPVLNHARQLHAGILSKIRSAVVNLQSAVQQFWDQMLISRLSSNTTYSYPYPSCSKILEDNIIFTGLIGRKVRDIRTSPARLSRV